MNEYPIDDFRVMPIKRQVALDALSRRVAERVVANEYENAREGAKANIVEYAGEETNNPDRLNWQTNNFVRKIVGTLRAMGYNKSGEPLIEPSN